MLHRLRNKLYHCPKTYIRNKLKYQILKLLHIQIKLYIIIKLTIAKINQAQEIPTAVAALNLSDAVLLTNDLISGDSPSNSGASGIVESAADLS